MAKIEAKTNAEFMAYCQGKKFRIFQDWETNTLIYIFSETESWAYDSDDDDWTRAVED